MAYSIKNFRLNVMIRVLIISALAILLAFIINVTQWLFTPLFIGVLLVIAVINLIFYVEKINKELSQFLYNIKQGGFTTLLKSGTSEGNQLGQVFNDVIEEFRKMSIEKESHYQYLKTLNENIGISIISYKENGEVTLINPAGKALLKKPYLKNIADLERIDSNLYKVITRMNSGHREVVKASIDGEMIQLSLQMKKFIMQEEPFNVLLLQNIHNELEQKEVEAWQKLIGVLTHEIMNSVTPIASLSTAVNQQLYDEDQWEKMEDSDRADIIMSLKTIENRSKGLLKFVHAYKEFSRTPNLNLSEVDLIALINRIVKLFEPDIRKAGVTIQNEIKTKEIYLRIDHELIEQVFINLIKNAIEALDNSPDGVIRLDLNRLGNDYIQVVIEDNGPGMEKEILDRIFIPFYTTKKKGTGVGLSFARQIMKMHGGNIKVTSRKGEGTTIQLEFHR